MNPRLSKGPWRIRTSERTYRSAVAAGGGILYWCKENCPDIRNTKDIYDPLGQSTGSKARIRLREPFRPKRKSLPSHNTRRRPSSIHVDGKRRKIPSTQGDGILIEQLSFHNRRIKKESHERAPQSWFRSVQLPRIRRSAFHLEAFGSGADFTWGNCRFLPGKSWYSHRRVRRSVRANQLLGDHFLSPLEAKKLNTMA